MSNPKEDNSREDLLTPEERKQRADDIGDPGSGCTILDALGNVVYAGPLTHEIYDTEGNLVMIKPVGKTYRRINGEGVLSDG
jgi:hypothetical protein